MEKDKVLNKIRSLPSRQQVGLWLIIRLAGAQNHKFSFKSSEFALKFKSFTTDKVKRNETEYGRFIGGILSGLYRNGLLIKLSGDRDKQWTLSDEIKDNFEMYKSSLFEIKTYWVK